MIGFWFKKNICDGWDNLYHMIVPNLVVLGAVVIGGALCFGANAIPVLNGWKEIITLVAFFLACGIVSVFIFAEGDNCAKVANFETPSIKNYFKNIVPSIKDGLFFGFLIAFLITVVFVSIPYYFNIWVPEDGKKGSILGLLCMAVVFWTVVIMLLSLQWFLPIRSLMHNNFKKCFKKSFLIFFDNPGLSIVVALNSILLIVLSVFCIFIIPGFTGVTLAQTNALRLRLYKYDWYEVNPGMTKQQRKQIPWDELLDNDKQTLGPRKFRNFLFPWKD